MGWGWWRSLHLHTCGMKHVLHYWHAANTKKNLCLFPQASNLRRLPLFLKPGANKIRGKTKLFAQPQQNLGTKPLRCSHPTGTQCELAHQSESELLALVDSYSFGSDRAVLNFVPSTCIVASTFEGRNWTSATNCRPTSCQWHRHWHAANTQNRWLSALPNTKYVEKQMIFEACLASLTWANFEDVFSKMQFLHSASSLLRHSTRCHHANKKKSSAQVRVFAIKANVQKNCVSLQRKLHFSCCCHWPHTLRSRGTSTPYVKRVYIHKNLHLEAWLTVYHWSASASKNEDWLKCDNGRFQQRNLLNIVSCNAISWTHVLSSPEMNRPSLTGGRKANATEEELDSSQKVKRGSTKLPKQLQKEWILFNHISGLKIQLACMGLSPPPFFAGSHQRRLPTPAKQARSLTPQIAGKDEEIDKTDETNTAKTCKNSEILILTLQTHNFESKVPADFAATHCARPIVAFNTATNAWCCPHKQNRLSADIFRSFTRFHWLILPWLKRSWA